MDVGLYVDMFWRMEAFSTTGIHPIDYAERTLLYLIRRTEARSIHARDCPMIFIPLKIF